VIVSPVSNGKTQLILADLKNNSWCDLVDSTILSDIAFDSVARLSDSSVLVIGSGTVTPRALYKVTIGRQVSCEAIVKSIDESFSHSLYSAPQAVTIQSKGAPSRKVYGFLWMPRNPKFQAPAGDLPPLIIGVHGGPPGHVGPGLKLRVQYFTSRGYAYFQCNYTGSTGHGREYREALNGRWGIVDADDAAECAAYLVASGQVKEGGVGITGGSAGGYNVLQSLIRHPKVFAAGICISGVSEVKKLGESTHKLESKYIDRLVLSPGMTDDEKEKTYRERSPVYHAANIKAPLLLLHGARDTVVPIDQARSMAKVIGDSGGDVKIVEFKDEGHGFSMPASQKLWLEEEERWWRRTLL